MDSDPLLEWRDGLPWSRRYGDVYHARDGALGQARHVFLDGNALPARFAALREGEVFTVGETGFGTGLSFLCAWQAFAALAPAGARLHFVSTELHPLEAADLSRVHAAWPALAREATALRASMGALPQGWHRKHFHGGRVALTLLAGDARRTLADLDATVDAWFLDGFAPDRNPELWGEALMSTVSSLSRPGTTAATWSSAGAVRRALESAGFEVRRAPGFAGKREMSVARCVAPQPRPVQPPWLARPPSHGARRAVVVGGGLAGAAAAAGLAARGTSVTLLERHGGLAAEASGNAQGVLYARLSPHGTALSRLLADGLSFSARLLRARLPADGRVWSPCGVLQLPEDEADGRRQAQLAAQAWPPGFLRAVDAAEAQRLAGVGVDRGGLWFGEAGWVHPPALCRALAESPRIRVVTCTEALDFEALDGGGWRVRLAGAGALEADTLVLANATDARAFAATGWLPLHAIRGQITHVPATARSLELRAVLCAESYVAPAREGWHCAGASFVIRDTYAGVRAAEQAANLSRLAALSPAFATAAGIDALDPVMLPGRAALRCASPDYLPLVGALPDAAAFRQRYAALSRDASTAFEGEAPWLQGLFVTLAHGSRGLVTAPLAGELVASLAFGEPLPVAAGVMRALAPTRFLARAMARHRG